MNVLGREVVDASHLFMVAAVSDFVTDYTVKKLSRKNGALNITLRPNIDIIKSIVKNNPNIISIAFSAQLDDELRFEKLKDKNVNFLVINNIKNNQVGSDYNEVSIINSDRLLIKTNRLSKYEIAVLIIDNTVL